MPASPGRAGWGKWPACFGRGEGYPPEVQGDPEKSTEAHDGPRDPREGQQGTKGSSLGCAWVAPETCRGMAGNLCSILCVPYIMTTLLAHLGNYTFGDRTVVSTLPALHSKGKE